MVIMIASASRKERRESGKERMVRRRKRKQPALSSRNMRGLSSAIANLSLISHHFKQTSGKGRVDLNNATSHTMMNKFVYALCYC